MKQNAEILREAMIVADAPQRDARETVHWGETAKNLPHPPEYRSLGRFRHSFEGAKPQGAVCAAVACRRGAFPRGRRGAPTLPIVRHGAILSRGRRGAPTLPVGSCVPRDRVRLFGRFVPFVA